MKEIILELTKKTTLDLNLPGVHVSVSVMMMHILEKE